MAGWLKLHRSVTDSFVFKNPDRLKFWIWCLCKASHQERETTVGLQDIKINKGQFIFGRKVASTELNMAESKIYRLLKTFEKREKIEVESNNKFSIVTVVNWEFYQATEQQSEQQSDNKLTTNEQQSNTDKKVKKEKKVKNKANTDDFKEIRKAYPGTKTKVTADKKLPDLIDEYGKEQILRSVLRYKKFVEDKRAEGFKDMNFLNESTFWNGRYVDYLDENYVIEKPKPKKEPKSFEVEMKYIGE